jgi:glutathione peroxidase
MSATLYDISVNRLDGSPGSLAEFKGQVLLIVNVASKCGLTPQYTGLESLFEQYRDKGLQVLGFPCNDFAGQEPGSADEIQSFCTLNYSVQFPMFDKVNINSEPRHALYAELIAAQPEAQASDNSKLRETLTKHQLLPKQPTDVMWNFEKFLVGRDGKVLARFAPDVTPDAPALRAAIEAALA